jgi:hypothetical protein
LQNNNRHNNAGCVLHHSAACAAVTVRCRPQVGAAPLLSTMLTYYAHVAQAAAVLLGLLVRL